MTATFPDPNVFGGTLTALSVPDASMGTTTDEATEDRAEDAPWQRELLDSEWLLAGAALLFFVLSYVVWGLIDLLTVPG